jgi:predicted regulator of Ras-like GTPase activity (Roadblock/LC7/MglB family)
MTMSVSPASYHPSASSVAQFTALLDELPQLVPGVALVVAASADGITRAASSNLRRENGDPLGAAASGIVGMISGIAGHLNAGATLHVLVELDEGFMVIKKPTEHALLLVLAGHNTNMDQLFFELERLGESAGQILDPGARVFS